MASSVESSSLDEPMPALTNRGTPVREASKKSKDKSKQQQQKSSRSAAAAAKLPTTSNKKAAASGKPPVVPKKTSNEDTKKKGVGKKKKREDESKAKKPPNYTQEEDLYLCKAYVSVSTDPVKGTGQKGSDFWDAVAAKFATIRDEESEVQVVGCVRDGTSILNRFQRQIQRSVNKYNKYYKQHKDLNPSGWNEEKFVQAAADTYLEVEGHPFKWQHCI